MPGRLALIDFPTPVQPLTTIRIPKSFNARDPQQRRDLASTLRNRVPRGDVYPGVQPYRENSSRVDPRIEQLRSQMKDHPCHQCPDREAHARWAERYLKLERDTGHQRGRIEQRTNTVARQFDRVCHVLDTLGYLDGDVVTPEGERLTRLYSELDLLVSECLRDDMWAGLDPAELAAVASGLTYRARRDDESASPRLPTGAVRHVADSMNTLCADLERLERENRLKFLHRPDFGFAQAVWDWCNGATLDTVLSQTEMAAGDFVRAMKQLIDVVAQIGDASGPGPVRTAARQALDELRHGVVSYSSIHG